MATIGFELEFENFQLDLGKDPDLKGTNLFLIENQLGKVYFRVTPDNYNPGTEKYGCLEVITAEPISTSNPLNLDSLNAFLYFFVDFFKKYGTVISKTPEASVYRLIWGPYMNLVKREYKGYVFRYTFNRDVVIFYTQRNFYGSPLNQFLQVGSQMTFGFPVVILEKFYNHFSINTTARDIADFSGIFETNLLPYTESSYNKFLEKLKSSIAGEKLEKEKILQLFFIVELFKAYVAYSGNVLPARINSGDYGYKAYFPVIMSRTAFSSMLQSLYMKFFPELKESIKNYIKSCFAKPLDTMFPEIYLEGKIGIPQKKYMNNSKLKQVTKETLVFNKIFDSLFADKEDIKFYLSFYKECPNGIIKLLTDSPEYSKDILQYFNKTIIDMVSTDKIWTAYTGEQSIININILKYDFFSPVPISPSDDPMGLYSRTTGRSDPLIEMRLMDTVYRKSNFYKLDKDIDKNPDHAMFLETHTFYTKNFQLFLMQQCDLALKDWL